MQKWYSVNVDWASTTVLLYLADEVTGPWEKVTVYEIPPPLNDLDLYITYAGKAHPELAGEEELIITYVANTWGTLGGLFEPGATGVYVPRFVRVSLAKA